MEDHTQNYHNNHNNEKKDEDTLTQRARQFTHAGLHATHVRSSDFEVVPRTPTTVLDLHSTLTQEIKHLCFLIPLKVSSQSSAQPLHKTVALTMGSPRSRSRSPRPDPSGISGSGEYKRMTQIRITLHSGVGFDFLVETLEEPKKWFFRESGIVHQLGQLLRINPWTLRLDIANDDENFAGPNPPIVFGIAPVHDLVCGEAKDARILSNPIDGEGCSYVAVQAAIEIRNHGTLTFIPPYCELCNQIPCFTLPVTKVLEWESRETIQVDERIQNVPLKGTMYMFDHRACARPLHHWLNHRPPMASVDVFISESPTMSWADTLYSLNSYLCPHCPGIRSAYEYPREWDYIPKFYQFYVVGPAMTGIFEYLNTLLAAQIERIRDEATHLLRGRSTPIPITPGVGENIVGSLNYDRLCYEYDD